MACWTHCLLLNDGALLLSVGWLGDPWDLYFGQFPDRALALLMSFGPAWAARVLFGLSASTYITLTHVLFFAVPVAFWLVLRSIEPQRAFSQLYLAMALALAYFPSELIVGAGFWTIWLALACDPARSGRQVAAATVLLGLAMAFTHPGTALMSVLFVAIAGALFYFGRPVPRRALTAALGLSTLLLAAFLIEGRWLHPTNPTIVAGIAAARPLFVDPTALLYTLTRFPALAMLWLLMAAPGADAARLRWRLAPWVVWLVAIVGLWFAINGTGFLFYLFVRYSAGYALALALALAVAGDAWAAQARRALPLFALVGAATALSYTFDAWQFGRYVDSRADSLQVAGAPGVRARQRRAGLRPLSLVARLLQLLPIRSRRLALSRAAGRRVDSLRMPGRLARAGWRARRSRSTVHRVSRRALLREIRPHNPSRTSEAPDIARPHCSAGSAPRVNR